MLPPKNPHVTPLGGVGQICLAENESHIYPNICAKFGCGSTVVSKRGGYRQTDRQTDRQRDAAAVDTRVWESAHACVRA